MKGATELPLAQVQPTAAPPGNQLEEEKSCSPAFSAKSERKEDQGHAQRGITVRKTQKETKYLSSWMQVWGGKGGERVEIVGGGLTAKTLYSPLRKPGGTRRRTRIKTQAQKHKFMFGKEKPTNPSHGLTPFRK